MTVAADDLATGDDSSVAAPRATAGTPAVVGDTGSARPTPALASPAPLPCLTEELTSSPALPPAVVGADAPVGEPPPRVRAWFDTLVAAELPEHDESLASARQSADAYARRAKAANTRRAYMAGVRAWCAWCDQHALPCLPASGADVAAFLAGEARRGRKVATIGLRRAAIRYLHVLAGCPVPTGDAQVSETVAGIGRHAAERNQVPDRKLAARLSVLRQMLDPIGDDLPGLRDRALLLVGFAGALRRSELAGIRVEQLEACERGLRLALPRSKGDRASAGVVVPLPYGATRLCPVRALRRWMRAADITSGPVFRRIWHAPGRPGAGGEPGRPAAFVVGTAAIEPRTVARIVQARGAAAGLDRSRLGGHSLKRGALTTGMDNNVHPMRLKRLGRHASYNVLDGYLELGEPFENHALNGIL